MYVTWFKCVFPSIFQPGSHPPFICNDRTCGLWSEVKDLNYNFHKTMEIDELQTSGKKEKGNKEKNDTRGSTGTSKGRGWKEGFKRRNKWWINGHNTKKKPMQGWTANQNWDAQKDEIINKREWLKGKKWGWREKERMNKSKRRMNRWEVNEKYV